MTPAETLLFAPQAQLQLLTLHLLVAWPEAELSLYPDLLCPAFSHFPLSLS